MLVIWAPKTARKGPRVQHVLLRSPWLLGILDEFLRKQTPDRPLFPSYAAVSRYVRGLLGRLGLDKGYGLGGIRGGRVTFMYLRGCPIDRIQRHGRWLSARSLEHYLQPGTAALNMLDWPDRVRERIAGLSATPWVQPFLTDADQFCD